MQNFTLLAGENCQVLSATGAPLMAIYRIYMTEGAGLELKIIRDNMEPIIVSSKQKHRALDIVTTGNLYIEAVGKQGKITGTYDCLGVVYAPNSKVGGDS